MSTENRNKKTPIKTICYEFIKIGSIGFGGGLAILGIIHNSFVERKKIISEEEFFSGTAISQFIGAFAVNTAYYVGRKLRGITGGIIAVISFLFPSFIAVILLSAGYAHFQYEIRMKSIIENIVPIVISILLITSYKFFKHYLDKLSTSIPTVVLLIPVVFFTDSYLICILAGGLIYLLINTVLSKDELSTSFWQNIKASTLPLLVGIATPWVEKIQVWFATPSIFKLSIVSLGIGTIFFGGGYALIPLIQQIMVERLHWISNEDFIFGITISQITPGPFAIIATYLGFNLFGTIGALISTILIFTPSIIVMELLIRFYEKTQKQKWLKKFIEGISLSVGFLILHLCLELSKEFLFPPSTLKILLLISSFTLLLIRIPPVFVILGGLLTGLMTSL